MHQEVADEAGLLERLLDVVTATDVQRVELAIQRRRLLRRWQRAGRSIEAMWAFSFAQLAKRSSRAMANCASASFDGAPAARRSVPARAGEQPQRQRAWVAGLRGTQRSLARFFCCSRLRRNAEGGRSVRSVMTIPFRVSAPALRQKRDVEKEIPDRVVGAALSADEDAPTERGYFPMVRQVWEESRCGRRARRDTITVRRLVPAHGLEPWTYRLRSGCSTS